MPRFKTKRIVAAIQAVSAFAAGILITFSQSHGAAVGMIALAVISVGWAVAFAWSAIADKKSHGRIYRSVLAIGSLAMAYFAGQSALLFGTDSRNEIEQGIWAWILIGAWGIFGALAEVILSLFAKPGSVRRRDHQINAALATGLGLSQFLTPISDAVTHVGFFGAYAVILSVHLGLAVLSPAKKAEAKKSKSKK